MHIKILQICPSYKKYFNVDKIYPMYNCDKLYYGQTWRIAPKHFKKDMEVKLKWSGVDENPYWYWIIYEVTGDDWD